MPTIPTSSRPSSDIHRVRAALKALRDIAADRVDLNDGPAWDAIAEAHSAWLWSTPEDAPPTAPAQAPGAVGDLRGPVHPDAIKAALAYADHFLMLSMAYSDARIEAWEDGTTSDREHAEARRDLRVEQGKHAEMERDFCRWWAPRDGFDGPVRALAAPSSDRGDATDGWLPIGDRPEAGKKIIALYNDGSGARMFWIYDGGMIDSDGDDLGTWPPDGCDRWAYLPDHLEFHCETWAENPVVLTLPAPPTPRPESSR